MSGIYRMRGRSVQSGGEKKGREQVKRRFLHVLSRSVEFILGETGSYW